MIKFIIGAIGRSGTKYISQFLTNNNVLTSHEKIFLIDKERMNNIPHNLVGESSTFVIAYLNKLPKNIIIYHQYRNPIKVIHSRVRSNLMSGIARFNKSFEHLHKILNIKYPEIFDMPHLIKFQVECYYKWNIEFIKKTKEFKYIDYMIENIDYKIFDIINHNFSKQNIKSVKTNINTRINYKYDNKIDDNLIYEVPYYKQLKDLAEKIGYKIAT